MPSRDTNSYGYMNDDSLVKHVAGCRWVFPDNRLIGYRVYQMLLTPAIYCRNLNFVYKYEQHNLSHMIAVHTCCVMLWFSTG